MKKVILICLTILPFVIKAQDGTTEYDASNPALVRSRFMLDLESYFFVNESKFYSIKPSYYYGLKNDRHQFGLSIPFFHNVFNGDYGGYENTSGIGDIKMSYMFVPIINKNVLGFERLSTYFEASAPTGEYLLGRGAGVWLYKPGMIATIHITPDVTIYPEAKYQFSSGDANSQGGSEGLPDPEDPDKEGPVKTLALELPAVVVMDRWDGWFALHVQYLRSFSEQTSFLYMRMDIGKMIGNKTSAALNIQKFIAGQPRLNVVVQAKFQFFLN